MRQQVFFLIITTVLLASCQHEREWEGAPEIKAKVESEKETRTSLSVDESGAGTIYWNPSDKIDVFFGTKKVHYTSQNTSDATIATFKTSESVSGSDVSSTNIWGLYPSSNSSTCNGYSITTTLPSTQYGVPNTFDKDIFPAMAHSSSTDLQFYNVCGGIKFNLAYDDIKKITFRGNNNEDLAGKVSISFVDNLPKATIVNGVKEITLTPKTGTTFTKGADYYIILLPVTLSAGFTITFTTTDGTTGTLNYTDNPVTIKRSIFGKKGNMDVYAVFSDDRQPNNVIYYTSSDGKVVVPTTTIFNGANLLSNEYLGDRGILMFDGDLFGIEMYSFSNCTSLTSIVLPKSVDFLEVAAFSGCSGLEFVIPNTITSIGQGAFHDCTSLTSIVLPYSVTSFGFGNPFAGCSKVTSISVDPANSFFDSRDNCNAIIHTQSNELVSGCNNTVIPGTVQSIGVSAFRGVLGLISIEIPASVTSIGGSAFSDCKYMTSITVYAEVPPELGDNVFSNTNDSPIYVPYGSVDAYKAAWSVYADRIQAMPDLHEAVDLGLSVKWATCNVGASAPEEYGDYFAWGETESKNNYDWSTYQWGTQYYYTKYCYYYYGYSAIDYDVVDNKLVLDPSDDAAHVLWGSKWRMPTSVEITELIQNCSWTGETRNGILGLKVTGKNGNSIFIPAAGKKVGTVVSEANTGHYWSSTLYMPHVMYAGQLEFCQDSGSFGGVSVISPCYFDERFYGLPIRPVYGDYISVESVSLDKASMTLKEGAEEQLTVSVSPSDATFKGVVWTSSDYSIATVEMDGTVTAVSAGTAIITAWASDGEHSATCSVTVTPSHEAVDLGLPSGVKWATCNIGASSPEDYGDYFAWGEIEPKNESHWSNYSWGDGSSSSLSKYNINSDFGSVDHKIGLELSDDAAHVKWGGNWRMPTMAEQEELHYNCTWTWTTQNGKNGYRVTGPNGNSIFLPAAGYRAGTPFSELGTVGAYWSSTLWPDESVNAHLLRFDTNRVSENGMGREYGIPIRPVYGEYIPVENVSVNKTSIVLMEGETEFLDETITPSNATEKSISWSSDNPSVATASYWYGVQAVSPGTATLTAWSGDGQKTATCTVTVAPLHEAVDLGLPSGVKWATCNVGADTPEEYGDYFAWGETESKSNYAWSTYKWCNASNSTFTKYCNNSSYGYNGFTDNKTVLDLSDDAARANWGGSWRMPTNAEWTELWTQCVWTWTTLGGKNGYNVRGPNGNTIFLPAAGIRYGTSLNNAGSNGYYWSSSLFTDYPYNAVNVLFHSSDVLRLYYNRYYGQSVRPVSGDFISVESISLNKSSLSITEGETSQLSATVMPANATEKTVTWTSSNTSVATVSSEGVVTAVSAGTATITAWASDGVKSATCVLTVLPKAESN